MLRRDCSLSLCRFLAFSLSHSLALRLSFPASFPPSYFSPSLALPVCVCVQTTLAMHENVARQLRDFLEEPIALEWGGHGDGLPILTMDPMRYQLKLDDVGEGETTNDG